LNLGPPTFDDSTLPLGYRGGGSSSTIVVTRFLLETVMHT